MSCALVSARLARQEQRAKWEGESSSRAGAVPPPQRINAYPRIKISVQAQSGLIGDSSDGLT